METEHKMVKFRLSSWNKLRREFYGRKNESFSDYIERVAKRLKKHFGEELCSKELEGGNEDGK